MPFLDLPAKAVKRVRNAVTPRTDWQPLLRKKNKIWQDFLACPKTRKVLIATSTGGHEAMTPVESLLAVALTMRGADVSLLLCDALLPACQMQTFPDLVDGRGAWSEQARQTLCDTCCRQGSKVYGPLGLRCHHFRDFLTEAETAEQHRLAQSQPLATMADFQEDGCRIGEHARAGALRFFARGDLNGEKCGEQVFRRYFEAALLTRLAVTRLFEKFPCDVAVFHHGIYVPQGVIGDVARRRHVRVVNWNLAYRKNRILMTHRETYHHALMQEPAGHWESLPWTPALELTLDRYLQSREHGTQDWISFNPAPQIPGSDWREKLGMLPGKPFALLLTNVLWDAQLHYPANAFSGMMPWILKTIRYFEKRPEIELLIRIHPAELHGIPRSRQPVAAEIHRHFPVLPANVFIVGPGNPVSTYALAADCDAALIYGTKTGVELAARGIPVIAAGEAWLRGKGISYDAASEEEFTELLNRLPFRKKMEGTQLERARKYAYHFFFRRMIPFRNLAERRNVWPPVRAAASSFEELLPKRDPGLDIVCDGILSGSDFVYPAERFHESRD